MFREINEHSAESYEKKAAEALALVNQERERQAKLATVSAEDKATLKNLRETYLTYLFNGPSNEFKIINRPSQLSDTKGAPPAEEIKSLSPAPRASNETKSNCVKHVMNALSGVAAVSEAIGMSLGMDDMEPGEKLIGFIPNSAITKKVVPTLYFFEYLAIYCKPAVENMQETINTILSKKLPDDWPKISSTTRKVFAYTLGVLPALYNAFGDFIAALYTATEQKWHPFIAHMLGHVNLITSLFSEGFETVKKVAELFADADEQKTETNSRNLLALLMKLLSFMGAIEEAIDSYAAMAVTFSAESGPLNTFFLCGSFANALCAYFFGVKTMTDAARAFQQKLSLGMPDPTEAVAFTLALFTGAIQGHIQRAFFISMLAAPEVALPITIPAVLTEIIGWGIATNAALYNVIGLKPFFHKGLAKLTCRSQAPEDIELTDFKAEADYVLLDASDMREPIPIPDDAEWEVVSTPVVEPETHLLSASLGRMITSTVSVANTMTPDVSSEIALASPRI